MEALNVSVGCTCDKFLGRFQPRLLSNLIILFFTLVNRFIVFISHCWLGLDMMMGTICSVSPYKVYNHTHTHTAPYCLHSRYLFLRWIVSEAERLHGDGSPQIRMRRGREGGGCKWKRWFQLICHRSTLVDTYTVYRLIWIHQAVNALPLLPLLLSLSVLVTPLSVLFRRHMFQTGSPL